MSDLASLLQVAPYAGAYQIGQAHLSEQELQKKRIQELAEIIRAKQQDYGQNEQMNPLKVDQQRLENQFSSQVKIPRGLEDLSKDQMANQLTRATQPGTIDATNIDNSEKVGKAMQEKMMRIGTQLESVPPLMRRQALPHALQSEGLDPSHPRAQEMMQTLQRIDPAKWSDYFTNVATQLGQLKAKQDPHFLGTELTAKERTKASKYEADSHLAGVKYAADKAANTKIQMAADKASKAAQGILDGLKSGKVSPANAAVQLEFLSQIEEDKDKKKLYADLAKKAEKFVYQKNAAVGAGRPTLTPEGGLGTVPPPTPVMGEERLPAGAAQKGPPGSPTNPIKLK